MLRSVAFRNMINFRQHHYFTLSPEDGSTIGILIGENGSGKSGLFELIRRCTSRSKNLSLSSLCDPDRDGYVVCKFQYDETVTGCLRDEKAKLVENIIGYKAANIRSIQSVYNQLSAKTHPSLHVFKIVLVESVDNRKTSLAEIYKKNSRGAEDQVYEVCMTEEESDELHETLENPEMPDLQKLLQRLSSKYHSSDESNSTTCEQISQILIENFTVLTFSHTGIGNLVWSKNEDIRRDDHWESNTRALILRTLLPKEDSNDPIFEAITDNSGYNFSWATCEDSKGKPTMEIKVTDTKNANTKCHLLKCPEGILLAKTMSLLIGQPNYFTLCLEEPDRSLHPQMVQRLRDQVIQITQKTGKTILVTSHRPYWIVPKTVGNIFCFRRLNGYAEGIQVGPALTNNSSHKAADLISFASSLNFRDVFFARKVLFVEGKLDHQLITIYFQQYDLPSDKPSVFYVNGCRNLDKTCLICKKLGIQFKCLCDRDWIMDDVQSCTMSHEFSVAVAEPLSQRPPKSLTEMLARWRQNVNKNAVMNLNKGVKECIDAIAINTDRKWGDITSVMRDIQANLQRIARNAEMHELREETSLLCSVKFKACPLSELESSVGIYMSHLQSNEREITQLLDGLQTRKSSANEHSIIRKIDEDVVKIQKLDLEELRGALAKLEQIKNSHGTEPTTAEIAITLRNIWRIVSVQIRILHTMFYQSLPDPKSFSKSTPVIKYGLVHPVKSTSTVDDIHQALRKGNIFSWRSRDLESMISNTSTDCTKIAVVTKESWKYAKADDWVNLVDILHLHNEEFQEFEEFLKAPYC